MDLQAWVDAETDPQRLAFRQATHLVLRAIAQSPQLSPIMVMKGGVLLAIRYHSTRFTRDIDFSTSTRFQDVQLSQLLATVEAALAPVSSDNEYGLALRLQSHQVKPPNRPEVSFPTLQMKVGYADRQSRGAMARLQAKSSPQTVQIDYSFNEWATDIEEEAIDGGALRMYPFHDLVAEKLRSVLQQPIRGRERYQDIYDLFLLLEMTPEISSQDRAEILDKLMRASEERQVKPHLHAMRAPQVIEMSRRHYASELPPLVAGTVPNFDAAYADVQDFFEALPWPEAQPRAD